MCPLTMTDTPSGTISRSRPPKTVAYSCTRLVCRIAWVKSTSTSPNMAVTVRFSGTTQRPSRRAGPKMPGDDPAAVEAHGLRGRHGQVRGQLRELAERPGREGALNPLGVFFRGEPPVAHRLGEQGEDPVPVSVGRAQVTRRLPWAHGLKLPRPGPPGHVGDRCTRRG